MLRRSERLANRRGVRKNPPRGGEAPNPPRGGEAPDPPPRENKADPRITAAINQALSDLLPNIVAQAVEAIRQQSSTNRTSDPVATGVENPNTEPHDETIPGDIHIWLERFHKQKPRTFSLAPTPMDAQNWIAHLEKIFAVLGCSDNHRVRLAVYKLEGDAHRWWHAWKLAHGGDAFVEVLSWPEFKEVFYQQYFPTSDKEAYVREYNNIRQRDDETVTEYLVRFLRLAGYAGTMAGTVAQQTQKFKLTLNFKYRVKLINQQFENVVEAANAAKNIEMEIQDYPSTKTDSNKKRGREGQGRDRYQRPTTGGVNTGVNTDAVPKTQCKICGKLHWAGICYKAIGACFICGQQGHIAKDCKNHHDNDKGKGKQTTTGGRVFAMTATQAENSGCQIIEEVGNRIYQVVEQRNQGSNNLQEISLTECKAYLRKHGLRLSGTKEECIQRIIEHGRLKAGRGESLYPRSSFSINCTGDACKGDTVLFTQKEYKKFDKVVRRGDIVVKRTVAGRIVKESYGGSKQQHTFTIEVLWSKGPKRLPPLSTLLVKGRNLYRFRTLRQPWNSEAERSEVLQEKHKRGKAARNKRKLKKTEIASNNDKGTKRQKLSHGHGEPSRSKQSTQTDKQKSAKKRGAGLLNESTTAHKRNALRFQKTESKRSQATFGADPNPQKASSSLPDNRTFLPNLHPQMFPPYSHYNNGEPVPNHVWYPPPGPYHYNPFPGTDLVDCLRADNLYTWLTALQCTKPSI